MISKEQYKIVLHAKDDIGWSDVSIRRWYLDETWSVEACMKIERVTDGQVRAVELRPDLFIPTKAQKDLAEVFIKNHIQQIKGGHHGVTIGLLNYFEFQCPTLYSDIEKAFNKTVTGADFMTERNAHRQYARN